MANWLTNLTCVPKGSFRSLQGYAAEQAFLARALKAGFNIFYKVWRDLEYDAVLDSRGTLFRIEVKGSSEEKFNLTRGGRAGIQIDRNVDKTRLINRNDCDFVACIDTNDFTCYLVPVEVVELLARTSFGQPYINCFREKWSFFLGGAMALPIDQIRQGLSSLPDDELNNIISQLNGGTQPMIGVPYQIPGTRTQVTDLRIAKVLWIWENL